MRLRNVSISFVAALALVASAHPAWPAAGLNLSWDDCGSTGTMQKTFACDTNVGFHVLVASAVAGVDMGQLNGHATQMDLATDSENLSAWWQLDNPLYGRIGCRYGAESMSMDFSGMESCVDPWIARYAGGTNFWSQHSGPNSTWIRTVGAIPQPGNSINGHDEYYVVKVVIRNTQTVGDGSCGGCSDGAAIVFRKLLLTQPYGVGDVEITDAPLERNYVKWQSGANVEGIPNPTPTKNTTWGAVKSLYRR